MSLLIKNATIVTATDQRIGDVRCREGVIAEIGVDLEPAGEAVVDGSDRLLLPGGVDPHVHMALPVAGTVSADDFESGTAAAIAGGTTTIVDFVHPERGQDMLEALTERRQEASRALIDHGLHMAVTSWSADSGRQMAACVDVGVPTFKIYLAYKDTVGLEDAAVVQMLATAAGLPAMVLVHAEHGDMIEHLRDDFAARDLRAPLYHARSRPPRLEGEATHRAATLASTAGAKLYVVHVTCAESVRAIAIAQAAGWSVRGETCPQYLLLDDTVYDQEDFEAAAAYVIAPPIRPFGHQNALWQALEAGVLDAVTTDHCPFTREQKALGREDFRKIPGGAGGIQHRLSLLYTHGVVGQRIGLGRFVDLVATRPAKLFGLYPRKGVIAVGSDADLVLWDPTATATISAATDHHNCDQSIFEGFKVQGQPSTVIVGGKIRAHDGVLDVERGAGRFLERSLA